MKETFENIFKPFLTNEIVINWIAPIITGLIVFAIPIGIAKLFQIKRDERKVKDANQRYIDSIRPYIIQEISVNSKFISDTRMVIVQESGVKEKYIYSELELRNKLIMDINESKYIDEKSKERLIKFAYKTFESFEEKNNELSSEPINNKNRLKFINSIINMPLIMFFTSMLFMIIAVLLNNPETELTENPLFSLPFLLAFVSVISIIITMISNILESKITRKYKDNYINENYDMYINKIFRNYIVHNDKDIVIKEKIKNKDKK